MKISVTKKELEEEDYFEWWEEPYVKVSTKDQKHHDILKICTGLEKQISPGVDINSRVWEK